MLDHQIVRSGVRREEQREAHLHTPGSGYAGQVRKRLASATDIRQWRIVSDTAGSAIHKHWAMRTM